MADNGLGAMEARFADLIWESEPVGSTELVRRAAAELGWKKSPTYTVLKRLAERGLFVNEDGVVRAMVKRADYYAERSERFVDESFAGSLPAFVTAFTGRKKLSSAELDELQALIDKMRG